MNASDLRQFQQGLEQLVSGEYVSQTAGFTSFPVNEALSHMVVGKSGPEEMQGIWWLKDHPTYGAMLSSFDWGTTTFHGNAGSDEPGYVYASTVQPGTNAVPDNQGNRSQLGWLVDNGLAFSFSKWNRASLYAGDASNFNTYLKGNYGKFPIPAAKAEGWTAWQQAKWVVNPKKLTDPAGLLCFCNVVYEGQNVITRNNFGKFAYQFLRVVDGKGEVTPFWQEFKSAMASLHIDSFVAITEPSPGVPASAKHMPDNREDVLV